MLGEGMRVLLAHKGRHPESWYESRRTYVVSDRSHARRKAFEIWPGPVTHLRIPIIHLEDGQGPLQGLGKKNVGHPHEVSSQGRRIDVAIVAIPTRESHERERGATFHTHQLHVSAEGTLERPLDQYEGEDFHPLAGGKSPVRALLLQGNGVLGKVLVDDSEPGVRLAVAKQRDSLSEPQIAIPLAMLVSETRVLTREAIVSRRVENPVVHDAAGSPP